MTKKRLLRFSPYLTFLFCYGLVTIDRAAEAVTLVPEQRLVAAQNGSAALPQTLEDLELGPADALARAEELDVRGADGPICRQLRDAGHRPHPG